MKDKKNRAFDDDKKPRIKEAIVVEGRDDTLAVSKAVDAIIIETHGFGLSDKTWKILDKAYRERGLIILTDPDHGGRSIRRKILNRFPGSKEAFISTEKASKKGDVGIENAAPDDIWEALSKARPSLAPSSLAPSSHPPSSLAPSSNAPSSGETTKERYNASYEDSYKERYNASYEESYKERYKASYEGSYKERYKANYEENYKERYKVSYEQNSKEHYKDTHKESHKKNYDMNLLVEWKLVGESNSRKRREVFCDNLGIGYSNAKGLLKKLNQYEIGEAEIESALSSIYYNEILEEK